jgi:16S rRNA (adenine1518-N6/adenine1519-N6)-dimethyltransferase
MTVTIQKELADRITARPDTRDYGALSVWIQIQSRVELVRVLPPSVFWPRPQVTSAIVHIDLYPALRSRIGDLQFFHDFVRSLFLHRRKLLRGELHAALKDRLDKGAIDRLLAETQISPELRAEQLDVDTMIKLSHAVRSMTE